MEGMSIREIWVDYRLLIMAVVILSFLAACFHLYWMPNVSYDPFAPFLVLKWTIEGTYFPLAALVVWLLGRWRSFWQNGIPSSLDKKAILPFISASIVSVPLAYFMKWLDPINFTSLVLWIFLTLRYFRYGSSRWPILILEWALVIILFGGASYVFTLFKAGLFHLTIPNDMAIVRAEAVLFGQPDLYVRFAEFGQNLGLEGIKLLESIYFQFFAHMVLVSVYLGALGNDTERHRYVFSLVLCYLIGAFSYYLLPALGPVFHDPARFTFLKQTAPTASYIQGILLRNTVAASRQFHGLGKLDVYGFIACMPSLHIAHEAIMLYFCRHSILLFGVSMTFFLATCVSVLVLGWHYLLDIPAGILVAAIVICCINRRIIDHRKKSIRG